MKIIGLPNPVAVLRSKLEDGSVRHAFDQAAKDWKITPEEVRDIFEAASLDNRSVPGDSTTARELRDLHRIRDEGSFLLSKTAPETFDAKLSELDALPKLTLGDNDLNLRSSQVSVNRIAIRGNAAGHPAPHVRVHSSVTLAVGADNFEIRPNAGESAMSILKRLQAEVTKGGYEASVLTARTPGGYSVLEIKGASPVTDTKLGSYGQYSGTVENRQLVAIGGEAPPSGSWLKLDAPVTVGGQRVSELFLGYEEFQDGVKARLNGRLDQGSFGGVETPASTYFALSGISDLKAGEPAFDGKTFTNAAGDELTTGYYNRPLIMDAPAVLFVFDPANSTAFRGSMGGFIPPNMNPFHGLNGSAKLTAATAEDRKALTFSADGVPSNAAGEALSKVSEHSQAPGVADGMATAWWLDAKANTLYQVNNGGIAGFNNFVTTVASFDQF